MDWAFCLTRRFAVLLLAASSMALLSGCASVGRQGSVRSIDYSETPGLKPWAIRAQNFADEWYPRIVGLLSDDPTKSPRQLNIVFNRQLAKGRGGATIRHSIYLNGTYFTNGGFSFESYAQNPTNFEILLLHELAHVAQQYRTLVFWNHSPPHWEEGMAEYVRYKLGYTNGWNCPQCDGRSPHYTSGYACAGAFLLFVDQNYGADSIRKLNAALRGGSYKDKFFVEATGKRIEELWADFRKTPAYLPEAADDYELRKLIGEPTSPKSPQRVVAFLRKQPGGKLTLEADEYLRKLIDADELPGVTMKERKGRAFRLCATATDLLHESQSAGFPASRKLYGNYEGGEIIYYIVTRASRETPWKLQRAWSADRAGKTVREYPLK